MQTVRIAAAQMGPTAESDTRAMVVDRMLVLYDEALARGAQVVVFPELALTPYFPKVIRDDYDQFFETSMPNDAVQPLFDKARETGTGFYLGYAEKTPEGRHFNTSVFVDGSGEVVSRYRKLHLPGLARTGEKALVYEPHYFELGEEGYAAFDTEFARMGMALCQDRRFPETYRVLALQGADIVMLGYNTPVLPLTQTQHELAIRSGAYANGLFVVAVAKAGVEDGVRLLGGSCIVDPHGEIIAKASTDGDEVVTATIRLDAQAESRGHWNFFWRRRPEHYGQISDSVSTEAYVPRPRPL